MDSARPTVKFTYKEYCTLPEGARYQLVEGDLVMSPAPSRRHQEIVQRILFALYAFVQSKGWGKVYASPIDVILSDEDVPQPDIVYVSNSRSSILVPEGIRGGPDLCVEVLSPGSEKLDRGAKRLLYARHDVVEYWIVDPDANRVEVYRLQEDPSTPERALSSAETLTTRLLPGFSMILSEVFAA